MGPFDKQAADKLAYEVAKMTMDKAISERSPAADAMLDYMRIGAGGGPKSVQEWIAAYLKRLEASAATHRPYGYEEEQRRAEIAQLGRPRVDIPNSLIEVRDGKIWPKRGYCFLFSMWQWLKLSTGVQEGPTAMVTRMAFEDACHKLREYERRYKERYNAPVEFRALNISMVADCGEEYFQMLRVERIERLPLLNEDQG